MDLDGIFGVVKERTSPGDPLGERLVSMVFAPQASSIWNELAVSVAHLDLRSGTDWDLFFVGLPAIRPPERVPEWVREQWRRWRGEQVNAEAFNRVATDVSRSHAAALRQHEGSDSRRWRYSGRSELVSVMSYDAQPDWLSLRSFDLARLGDAPLAQVTERLTPWADGPIDTDLSPGLPSLGDPDLRGLAVGLLQTGLAAVGGGVASNAAWELIRTISTRR